MLGIRGTASFTDVFTDLTAEIEDFIDGYAHKVICCSVCVTSRACYMQPSGS